MVKISNIYDFSSSQEGLGFLKNSISEIIPLFKIEKTYDNGSYYGYGVSFSYKNIFVRMGCEKNALTHLVEIEKEKFTLYQFDENMQEILAFSKDNIQYTLHLLKKVLEQKEVL